MSLFTGSGVAIITPFHDSGKIHYEKLQELIDWHVACGTDAIVICGTTGEASTLNDEEHLACIKAAVDATNGRLPVIAGTGSNDTAHGIALSKEAERMGVDGLLQVTPYYNKTTQRGLVAHFGAIANAVNIPIMLYNVPSRTGMCIEPTTAFELSKLDTVVAIKEASGDMSKILQMMTLTQGDLDLYSGNDDQIVPILSLGGKGVVSVVANILPTETHDIVAQYLNGNTLDSLKLQMKLNELTHNLFTETNPIPIKEAMNLLGKQVGPCRLPLYTMGDDTRAHLIDALNRLNMEVQL